MNDIIDKIQRLTASDASNSLISADTYLEYGNAARKLGQQDDAIVLYLKAMESISLDSDLAKLHLDVMMSLYDLEYARGNLVAADTSLLNAVKIARINNLELQEANLTRIRGHIYYAAGDIAQCIEFYTEALRIYKKLCNKAYTGRVCNNMAFAFVDWDTDQAEEYAQAALKINTILDNELETAKSLLALSVVKRSQKDFESSRKLSLEALEIFERIHYKSGVAKVHHQLAILSLKQREYDAAIESADASDNYLQSKEHSSNYPFIVIKNCIVRSMAYEAVGNKRKAHQALKELPKIQAFESVELMLARFQSAIYHQTI